MAYMALAPLKQARHAFFDRRELPVGQVADTILKSWIRCTESGLDETRAPVPNVDLNSLEAARQRREIFRKVCAPHIEGLYLAARDMGGAVSLSDETGQILDVVGDNSFAGQIKIPSLKPGIDWSEPARGTNAIGTALIEKRAVCVNGEEHFIRDYRQFSCAAVPVVDLRGEVLGVVNLTTPTATNLAGALGMVRLSVEQIEHRLALTDSESGDRLRFHTNPAYIGTVREGIMLIREGRVVGCNRNGLSLMGQSWTDIDGQAFERLFASDADDSCLSSLTGREYACLWERRGGIALPSGVQNLAEMEETLMRKVVDAHQGNISAAARHLGVHRSTLYRRLKGAVTTA